MECHSETCFSFPWTQMRVKYLPKNAMKTHYFIHVIIKAYLIMIYTDFVKRCGPITVYG